MPPSDELMRVALRVLDAYTSHTLPNSEDVKKLRAAVSPPASQWEPEVLAGHIIERELLRKRYLSATG